MSVSVHGFLHDLQAPAFHERGDGDMFERLVVSPQRINPMVHGLSREVSR